MPLMFAVDDLQEVQNSPKKNKNASIKNSEKYVVMSVDKVSYQRPAQYCFIVEYYELAEQQKDTNKK
jgi:hypothetical protein